MNTSTNGYTIERINNEYQKVTKHSLVLGGEIHATIHEYADEVTYAVKGEAFKKADSVEAAKRLIDENLLELAGMAA